MVSLSVADARALVPEFQTRQKASVAWTRLQVMIAQGQAELLAWPIVWLRTDSHGTSESCLENRYPTEYTPPQIPQTFSISVPPASPTSLWGADTPTAFETRNTGATVDVTALKAARDGADVELAIVSGFSRQIRTREWRIQKSPLGIEGVVTQPDFQTSKATTRLWAHRGEPLLIGVFLQSEPVPYVELHILHARSTLLPPGLLNPPAK
jgi:hypothetical protein